MKSLPLLLFIILLLTSCFSGQHRPKTPAEEEPEPTEQFNPPAHPETICQRIVTEKKATALVNPSQVKELFLQSHNDIRQRYGLPMVTWDEEMAEYAQRWASYLKENHQCHTMHRSHAQKREGKRYGENLASYWRSPKASRGAFISSPNSAILDWASECLDFDLKKNSCQAHKACGHFTQIIWKDTRKIGCGVATCLDKETSDGYGQSDIWVCNYDPAGNMILFDSRGKQTPQRPF